MKESDCFGDVVAIVRVRLGSKISFINYNFIANRDLARDASREAQSNH